MYIFQVLMFLTRHHTQMSAQSSSPTTPSAVHADGTTHLPAYPSEAHHSARMAEPGRCVVIESLHICHLYMCCYILVIFISV